MAYVSMGIRPNNQLAIEAGAEVDERGLIPVDRNGQSSLRGLYVAGDLCSDTPKQIYTAITTGTACADGINRILRAEKCVGEYCLPDWKPCYDPEGSEASQEVSLKVKSSPERPIQKKNICSRLSGLCLNLKNNIYSLYKSMMS